MEYQFTHSMHGVIARCSMDHEAFARWLNTEITDNSKDLSLILTEIERCKQAFPNQYQAVFEGREYTLILDSDEVIVKANNLEDPIDEDLMEEGLQFYDQESIAFCGLEDFEAFLNAYREFMQRYH